MDKNRLTQAAGAARGVYPSAQEAVPKRRFLLSWTSPHPLCLTHTHSAETSRQLPGSSVDLKVTCFYMFPGLVSVLGTKSQHEGRFALRRKKDSRDK